MLILAAGMNRSGSTWLYNVIRLLLNKYFVKKWIAGWVYDIDWQHSSSNILIKVHQPSDELFYKADLVLYSYRDLRDALASLHRKFGNVPTLELAESLIENDRYWTEKSAYCMCYEKMLKDPLLIIEEVAETLGLESISAEDISKELKLLSYTSPGPRNHQYHEENLFHKGHVTDGRAESWAGQLSPELLKELENEYGDWLVQRGYRINFE